MNKTRIEQMLADEDFIYYGATQYLYGYYGSLCTSEEIEDGKHYDLLIADIKSGNAEDVYLEYLVCFC